MKIMQKIKVHGRACQHCDILILFIYVLIPSAVSHVDQVTKSGL